jgi:O-methyltransferase involved in polyketide biosynthesis
LPLPSDLYWIEVDLPHVLAYKTELLIDAQPVCKLERVPLDITDDAARQAFLAQMDTESRQVLVICEGLLIYLTEQQVSSLATDLHAHSFIRWWLAEFVTPRMLQQDEQGWNTYTAESVHAHFSLPTKTDFFQLLGWNVIEFRSMVAEALRLRLPIQRAWLLRLMARISPPQPGEDPYNIGAFILLENKPLKQKRSAHLGSKLRRARNVKR